MNHKNLLPSSNPAFLPGLSTLHHQSLSSFAPEFIPQAKRHNETFLKIFNDSVEQFLTAAASTSNAAFASQFPNVLGRNGLVPPCSINLGKNYEYTFHRYINNISSFHFTSSTNVGSCFVQNKKVIISKFPRQRHSRFTAIKFLWTKSSCQI